MIVRQAIPLMNENSASDENLSPNVERILVAMHNVTRLPPMQGQVALSTRQVISGMLSSSILKHGRGNTKAAETPTVAGLFSFGSPLMMIPPRRRLHYNQDQHHQDQEASICSENTISPSMAEWFSAFASSLEQQAATAAAGEMDVEELIAFLSGGPWLNLWLCFALLDYTSSTVQYNAKGARPRLHSRPRIFTSTSVLVCLDLPTDIDLKSLFLAR
jgi:hypothetical protein